jgi:hypothetical protein
MKTKIRYAPPLLVDMRGPALCGEFITCGSGSSAGFSSCWDSSSCRTGTGAERCQQGNYACGCDSCCETGGGFTSNNGYYMASCECKWGSQAAINCNDGQYTGGPCANGYTASYTCSSGTAYYAGGDTQWCNPGYWTPA